MALFDPTNVVEGAAAIFLQPYIAGTPPVLPPDTTAFVDVTDPAATAWPSPWVPTGATSEGMTFGGQRQTNSIMIEEQSTPASTPTTSNALAVTFTCAEDTLESMKTAFGGGTITVNAAASGTPGTRTLKLSEQASLMSVGFEGRGPGVKLWRRVLVPITQAGGTVSIAYRRAASARLYAVTLNMLCPIGSVVIKEWNAAALP